MPNYQNAAARRSEGNSSPKRAPAKEQKPNMGAIQQLIDATQQSPDQGPLPQMQQAGPQLPGPLGDNKRQMEQGYQGPGALELQEALQKGMAGVDEPGPPESVIRRMKKQQMQMSLQPDVADLAARYGVIPRG